MTPIGGYYNNFLFEEVKNKRIKIKFYLPVKSYIFLLRFPLPIVAASHRTNSPDHVQVNKNMEVKNNNNDELEERGTYCFANRRLGPLLGFRLDLM